MYINIFQNCFILIHFIIETFNVFLMLFYLFSNKKTHIKKNNKRRENTSAISVR